MDDVNKEKCGEVAGRAALIIGNECEFWGIQEFVAAARWAKAHGIDTINPKRANGADRWYKKAAQLAEEYRAVTAEGVGYIPFGYVYTLPRCYGMGYIEAQAELMIEMQRTIGALQPDTIGWVMADMEVEMNGRLDCAECFTQLLAPGRDLLFVTSWADPREQNWLGVLNILRNCLNCFLPQAYNDWLESREYAELPQDMCIQTMIDLTQEFGANQQIAIAQAAKAHGQTTIWMWEYQAALRNPALVDELVREML